MMNQAFDLTDYSPRDPRELLAELDAARGPVNPVPSDEAAFVKAMDSKYEGDAIPF